MPKGTPEGAKRPSSSGGSMGARGSSGSASASRRTAKTIKDINKPNSKRMKNAVAAVNRQKAYQSMSANPNTTKTAPSNANYMRGSVGKRIMTNAAKAMSAKARGMK